MGDHRERACCGCGSLLHHEDDCRDWWPRPDGSLAVGDGVEETRKALAAAARERDDALKLAEERRGYARAQNTKLSVEVDELRALLTDGVQVVSSACALGDAAAQDTEHAHEWEKRAAAWLKQAGQALEGGK